MSFSRRSWLQGLSALGALSTLALAPVRAADRPSAASAAPARQRLLAAWHRGPAGTEEEPLGTDHAGVLVLDWEAGAIRIESELALPQRIHGLALAPQGGYLLVANRPGRSMVHIDEHSRVVQRLEVEAETPPRTFNGHVHASADGQWLYTTETDPRSGEGWISVRDPRTLRRVGQWRSHGLDPHQILLDADGALLVTNGGIPRNARGRKQQLDRMDPSLVRLDARDGALLGQWRLPDPRLSLRHLAWALDDEGSTPLLGLALAAEHDEAARRREAPALALWDGERLSIPSAAAQCEGYTGDVAAAAAGGFVLSGQKAGRGVLWHPGAPKALTTLAELREICALASWQTGDGTGVLMAAAGGVARWHPRVPPRMLAWPEAMQPDNHCVLLG